MAAPIQIGAPPARSHAMVSAFSQYVTRLNRFQELDIMTTIFLLALKQKVQTAESLIAVVPTLQVVVTTSNISLYLL
jgi:hypothetical protein